ncbi:hypothetical protein FisN_18Lh129 [Fistulifera solaris]|uniref:Transmembrane protein n=1 Tax=Fistulifera solaris TaxID=1519565 RepID=A0A1Z5KFC3_FISSO|nr:hypothetical protein FisN_18Lh129 [Fistulifera solaris]|eukprot:GAX24792.1 hypothetical protein FisN_18Lh129 [Fistulifera solaris]
MARSKQTKSSDGKHRKETKEERRIRLEKQEEARQACFKLLPWAGVLVVAAMIAFALYVRSVPPRPVISLASNVATSTSRLDPEFIKAMNRPIPDAKEKSSEGSDSAETIEL